MAKTDRRKYLLEVAARLREDDQDAILARALAVIAKWENGPGVAPRYPRRWREIIATGPDAIEELALSETDEADELLHCMPFAGILTNHEKRKLDSKYKLDQTTAHHRDA